MQQVREIRQLYRHFGEGIQGSYFCTERGVPSGSGGLVRVVKLLKQCRINGLPLIVPVLP